MIIFEILQAAINAIVYSVLTLLNQNRTAATDPSGKSNFSARSYVWGLLFATLFYYALPLWWWRYGLWRTLYVIFLCVGAGVIIRMTIGASGFADITESFFITKILSIPIMVGAGLWVARNDKEWRQSIISKRADKA